jgi:hypothetical protein
MLESLLPGIDAVDQAAGKAVLQPSHDARAEQGEVLDHEDRSRSGSAIEFWVHGFQEEALYEQVVRRSVRKA